MSCESTNLQREQNCNNEREGQQINKYKPEFDVILDTRHPLPARDIRWIEGAVAHRQIRRRIDAVDQRGAASTGDGVGNHGQDVALVVVVGHDKGNFILGISPNSVSAHNIALNIVE